jgi:plasmid stabilization system protein ParE
MANNLFWTERALIEYEKLIDYLLEEWGEEITLKVRLEIDQTIDRIKNSPEHFPIFLKSKKIRRCVASPQTSIFFRVSKDVIILISLFDNRQNPKKHKL